MRVRSPSSLSFELKEKLGTFEDKLANLVSALCFCFPAEFYGKSAGSEAANTCSTEASPSLVPSWYSVRAATASKSERFTVRRIGRNPQQKAKGPVSPGKPSLERAYSCKGQANSDRRNLQDVFSSTVRRSQSVPPKLERWCGMIASEKSANDEALCSVCCSEVADVVLLPCRHGGLCFMCFRRILFLKPQHRGGCVCPICRRPIREAVRIEREELQKSVALWQYGVGIGI